METLTNRLSEEPGLGNLRIADRNEDTLQLIVESEYCFGVSSTSVFEAVALKTKVLLYELPGWNHSELLIERGEAVLVTDPAQPKEFLKQAKLSANSEFYYADGSKLLPKIVESNL